MIDAELDALVQRLDDMSDLSRDHAAGLLDLGHKVAVSQAITAITTLRAQLAEAQRGRDVAEACNRGLVRLNEVMQARAERAEAALAAQIEVDAGMLQSVAHNWGCGCAASRYCKCAELAEQWSIAADEIRTQPHDRTALDRVIAQTREKALREAAEILDDEGWLGMSKHRILALIEADNAR